MQSSKKNTINKINSITKQWGGNINSKANKAIKLIKFMEIEFDLFSFAIFTLSEIH